MCCKGSVKKAKSIATGFVNLALNLNEEMSKERLKICYNCPKLQAGIICSICGCAVDAKTRVLDESCPLKKWLPSNRVM